jgi:hypothetical protein
MECPTLIFEQILACSNDSKRKIVVSLCPFYPILAGHIRQDKAYI